jgi:hypothetical protein
MRELMSDEPVQERRVKLLEHFVNSINRGEQPEPGFSDNRKALAIVCYNHVPFSIRLVYIISNGSGVTLISPRNGLSNAAS